MKHFRSSALVALALVGLATALPASPTRVAAAGGPTYTAIHLVNTGSVTYSDLAAQGAGAAPANPDVIAAQAADKANRPIPRGGSGGPLMGGPALSPAPLAGPDAGFFGFDGLANLDQRSVSTFSVEPSDQGLCAGNGYVVEAINLAIRVYRSGGTPLGGPVALNHIFGLKIHAFLTGDPRCYYDADSGHWFLTVYQSNFSTYAQVDIAVSKTGNPTGGWNTYSFDVTGDGGGDCPCFGDQPLLGADANGIYISTNAFSLVTGNFDGAQVYALSKAALLAGGPVSGVHIGSIYLGNNLAYSIQPATAPNSQYDTENGGTEYFLASDDFSTYGNHITVWAVTNSSALDVNPLNVTFAGNTLSSEPYLAPVPAQQKWGPTPLGSSLGAPLEMLNTDDDRMQQVVYAGGMLWSGLTTRVGMTGNGIAYFVVKPSPGQGPIGATIAKQGYLAANDANLMYPSIGVDSSGQGVISFSLSGADNYPSTGYARISLAHGVGALHVAGSGVLPEDGFTGYAPFGGNGVARWGDYSAAVYDPSTGNIVMAAGYIPGRRSTFANWGTFISEVNPLYIYG